MDPSLPLTASQALALGNPAMCLLFALGFACIWAHERPRTYLLLYAAAFAVYAAGTLLRIFDRPDATGDDLAAAVLYVGSALLLARGLFARCGIDADGSPLGALGIALLVLLLHFHIMQNDVPAFAYTLGVGMGALLLLAWMRLGKLRRGAAADQVLYWVLPFVSAGLFLGISWWRARPRTRPANSCSPTSGCRPSRPSASPWHWAVHSLPARYPTSSRRSSTNASPTRSPS